VGLLITADICFCCYYYHHHHHYHHHYHFYAGYLYIYSWDKPCP